MGEPKELAVLRRQMSTLLEDLREIRDQGKKAFNDPDQVWLFSGMVNSLDSSFGKFDDCYNRLCAVTDSEGDPYCNATDHTLRATAKRYYHEAHGYDTLIKTEQSRQSMAGMSNVTATIATHKTKLPVLDLPKFRGDRTEWPRFQDTFCSLVKEDSQLNNIDKFHYLVRSLEGPALAVISQIVVIGENFPIAWEKLTEVYDNKRLLATTYLDKLFDMKRLTSKPNAFVLNKLVSELAENVAAFNLVDIPNRLEFIYFYCASRCLDVHTRELFEMQNRDKFPTFDNLIKYLRTCCTAAELAAGLPSHPSAMDVSTKRHRASPWRSYDKPTGQRVTLMANTFTTHSSRPSLPSENEQSPVSKSKFQSQPCFICRGPHQIFNCVKFGGVSVADRHNLLEKWNGCRSCLSASHKTKFCPSKYGCRFCKSKMHHSLLHGYQSSEGNKSENVSTSLGAGQSNVRKDKGGATLNAVGSNQLEILLGTALCFISDSSGRQHKMRLAIDSGSHFSFITWELAKRLQLEVVNCTTGVWGIGEVPLSGLKGRAACSLKSVLPGYPSHQTTVIVVKKITSSLPGFHSEKSFWQPYLAYELADPEFWIPRPIEFLLGCDLFPDILTGPVITISPTLPKLIGTTFGLAVFGRVSDVSEASSICALLSAPDAVPESLNHDLKRFWEMEEPPVAKASDPDNDYCESLFQNTHKRLPSGRYVVRLPFKTPSPQILGTKGMAIRRLEHLERKLERNSTLRDKYHEFMKEYVELGHMEVTRKPGKVIIPHHAVVKGEGDALKVRVVFDASARTASGALNDILLSGPKLQTNMVDICLQFRCHAFVFTTDVVKMFRQVLVEARDRPYQHILWRFNPAEAIQEYELKTLSYGTAPAPYLAIRTMHQLAVDHEQEFPLAAKAIVSSMYVDDLVTGASTLEACLELQRQVIGIMEKGQFALGKWAANHPSLLLVSQDADSTHPTPVSFESHEEIQVTILGLQWDPTLDCFSYKFSAPPKACTKRAVLSAITKIYDPLGYIGPAIVVAKILVQQAWKQQLDWDQPFPAALQSTWLNFLTALPLLGNLRIPRWIVPASQPYCFLIFADASERAYCASAYLRSVTVDGPQVHLVYAKTKLAPVKAVTIPRLELCAALLAARVWQTLDKFCSELLTKPTLYFFSDSSVVLRWLEIPTHRLKTFVANRVEKIRELTREGTWRHVASLENPSDLGSRGISPSDLLDSSLWFNGPAWALLEPHAWPQDNVMQNINLPEMKDSMCQTLLTSPEIPNFIDWFIRFSKFNRLVRSLAYVLRFIARCRKQMDVKAGELTTVEIRIAKHTAVRLVQHKEYFNGKIPDCRTPVPAELLKLHPFFNPAGTLLVGGRLKHSDLSWDIKHPVVLPGKSYLARLILEHIHQTSLHSGPSLVLSLSRQQYWITGARRLARQVVQSCVKCRRFDASSVQPPMGDLPAARFREGRAFLHTGIDFAGPFLIKDSLRRKASLSKSYLCLFVCLSTKALHLELVSSLSTTAFFAAMDRFVGRRGLPQEILSDNGRNFVGAANELKDLYEWLAHPSSTDAFVHYATEKEVKWTFTPPHAPFFGGVWESAVKSVKRLLRSVYGTNNMTFEELTTWLVRVEAALNSRPLCPLSHHPDDLSYLSPGHFLIGSPLLATPEKTLLHLKENRLSRWQLVKQKAEHFWRRWRVEYLTSLQERNKWLRPSYNLQVGDLVLLKDENTPRLRWPIGRVTEVFPGSDEVVRVVLVKTQSNILKRPVSKLVPLFPVDS